MPEIIVRKRLKTGGNYFDAPPKVNSFTSGCRTLDLVLGNGWAEGKTINIVGDRSTGKCIRNAYIQTSDGMVLIDDYGAEFANGTTEREELLGATNGERVMASHFYREEVDKTIVIRTRHGYSLEGTVNHPILVLNSEMEYEWRQLGALHLGDTAVITGNACVVSQEQPIIFNSHREGKKAIIPPYVNEKVAYLLGLWVANGCVGGRNTIFTSGKSWFKRNLYSCLKEFGIESARECDRRGTITFWVHNATLFALLNHLLDGALAAKCTARFKFVPSCILKSPLKVQAAFLRALLDCDSHFAKGGVEYYTASRQLAQQVQLLLLNFKVFANWSRKPGPKGYEDHLYNKISFWGPEAIKYLDRVGSSRSECCSPGEKNRSDYNSIPNAREFCESLREKLKTEVGWCPNGRMLKRNGMFPHFQWNSGATIRGLTSFVETFLPLADLVPEEMGKLQTLLSHENHYDPITAIKTRERKVPVYDFHVPEHHRFWSNGFLSHNTLLAIEACANFFAKYPNGEIRYRELENAFDENYASAIGFPKDKVDLNPKYPRKIGNKDVIQDSVETVEDFYSDLKDFCRKCLQRKKPGLYIIDSLDAIGDDAERAEEFGKNSYGAKKAKLMKQLFGRCIRELGKAHVTLIVISQLYDKIGVMFGEKQGRTGGRALDYFAVQVVWLANLGQVVTTRNKIKRPTGVRIRVKCKKNKVGLPFRECEFCIRYAYGIDDLESILLWMIEHNKLEAVGLRSEKEAQAFLKALDKLTPTQVRDERKRLEAAISKCWWEVEKTFLPKRTKYGD